MVELIKWKTEESGVRVWKHDDPDFFATGNSLELALDSLYAKCLDASIYEVAFELDPRPALTSLREAIRYVGLGYDESVLVLNEPRDLFDGGVCARCRVGLGRRTGDALIFKKAPKTDVFVAQRPWPNDVWPKCLCVSERFVAILTDPEIELLALRPVQIEGVSKLAYFEAGAHSALSPRGLVGEEYATKLGQSWCCSACSARTIVFRRKEIPNGSTVLSLDELPSPLPEMFIYNKGALGGAKPAFSFRRWSHLQSVAQSSKLKGVCGMDVLLFPSARTDQPTLPDYPQ